MQKKKYISKMFMGCLMLTVLLLCGCAGKNDLVIETSEPESVTDEATEDGADLAAADAETPGAEEARTDTAQPEVIYVQVTGAVRAPGVYELPAGSRVFEAVQRAGGMTGDAASESLNQALEVSDGQMIVLYTTAEWELMKEDAGVSGAQNAAAENVPESEPDDGRVNINTAGLEELCTISGIGESRAQSIITYREQNGAFGSVEEIMNVSGIKEGLFQKIKDKIKV